MICILGYDKQNGNSKFWDTCMQLKYACRTIALYRDIIESDISEFVVFVKTPDNVFLKYSGTEFMYSFDHPDYHK